jgi:hypothetical protein
MSFIFNEKINTLNNLLFGVKKKILPSSHKKIFFLIKNPQFFRTEKNTKAY